EQVRIGEGALADRPLLFAAEQEAVAAELGPGRPPVEVAVLAQLVERDGAVPVELATGHVQAAERGRQILLEALLGHPDRGFGLGLVAGAGSSGGRRRALIQDAGRVLGFGLAVGEFAELPRDVRQASGEVLALA